MASTTTSSNNSNSNNSNNGKLFHTYENVGYEANHHYDTTVAPITTNAITTAIATSNNGLAINKTAIESPFPDPLGGK